MGMLCRRPWLQFLFKELKLHCLARKENWIMWPSVKLTSYLNPGPPFSLREFNFLALSQAQPAGKTFFAKHISRNCVYTINSSFCSESEMGWEFIGAHINKTSHCLFGDAKFIFLFHKWVQWTNEISFNTCKKETFCICAGPGNIVYLFLLSVCLRKCWYFKEIKVLLQWLIIVYHIWYILKHHT